ncbi:MAG: A24 family peptidase [Mycobacteriaceae bacterium]
MLATVLLSAWGAALCVSDVRRLRLPNVLTLGGAAGVLAAAAAGGHVLAAVCGGVALGAVYLTVYLAAPGQLGGGDVKLALGLGALTGALGLEAWVLAAVAAPVLTAAAGLAGAARGRRGPIPHGAAMVLASLSAAALAVF